MRQRKRGKRHYKTLAFLVPSLFLLSGCRDSQPPQLSVICIGDGFGGADCVDSSGNKVYKSPSQLLNYWMTTQGDEANFAGWCYDTNSSAAQARMAEIQEQAQE